MVAYKINFMSFWIVSVSIYHNYIYAGILLVEFSPINLARVMNEWMNECPCRSGLNCTSNKLVSRSIEQLAAGINVSAISLLARLLECTDVLYVGVVLIVKYTKCTYFDRSATYTWTCKSSYVQNLCIMHVYGLATFRAATDVLIIRSKGTTDRQLDSFGAMGWRCNVWTNERTCVYIYVYIYCIYMGPCMLAS